MYQITAFLFVFSLSVVSIGSENKKLLAGDITFIDSIKYSEAVIYAERLSSFPGMQTIFVRKMGPDSYGVSLILNFSGTKDGKHQILNDFRKSLGGTIKSWDLATGVTWIKK